MIVPYKSPSTVSCTNNDECLPGTESVRVRRKSRCLQRVQEILARESDSPSYCARNWRIRKPYKNEYVRCHRNFQINVVQDLSRIHREYHLGYSIQLALPLDPEHVTKLHLMTSLHTGELFLCPVDYGAVMSQTPSKKRKVEELMYADLVEAARERWMCYHGNSRQTSIDGAEPDWPSDKEWRLWVFEFVAKRESNLSSSKGDIK